MAEVRAVLAEAGVPAVLVATGVPPAESYAVTIDDHAAAAEMMSYLLALGHRRIGFVKGDPYQTTSAECFAGYRAALEDAGVAFDVTLVADGDFSYRSGLATADRLLSLDPPPSVIFASNDDMAAATVAVAHRRGLDIPRDLSVVGYDDTSIATTIWPELTTIRQPIAQMAQAAIEMLVAAARRGGASPEADGRHRLFSHALILRGSGAAFATGRPRPSA